MATTDEKTAWKATTGQKIERPYAWIALKADGGEGIIALRMGNKWLPAIGADLERVESMRTAAQTACSLLGATVRLKVFATGETLEELTP